MDVDHTEFEEGRVAAQGLWNLQRGSHLPLGFVNLALNTIPAGPLGCQGTPEGGGGGSGDSSKEQQGLIRGFCGFAEMKDGQGDQDREESGQVGRSQVLTSQLWLAYLNRASNSTWFWM